jgi:FlaG/FlaF family flagellin (archaellin)
MEVPITFTATAGKAPWTIDYTLNAVPMQVVIPVGMTTATVQQSIATPGTYTYSLTHVSDGNGCGQDITGTATVTVDEIVITDISTIPANCEESDGSIDITVTGGFESLEYEWFDEDGNLVSTDEDPTGLAAGTYTVVITDPHPNGCSIEQDIVLGVAVELTPQFFIDQSTFDVGVTRDAIYSIANIGANQSGEGVQVIITKTLLSAFNFTLDPNMATADVFGGIPVSNSMWTFQDFGTIILATLKPGFTIPSGGSLEIGLTLTAVGTTTATAQTTLKIVDFTACDVRLDNNFAQGSFSINL